MDTFSVDPSGKVEVVACECCGDKSTTVNGFVQGGGGETAYSVHWTNNKIREHGAHFDLLMTSDPEHLAISLEFRITEDGPGFMVIDAGGRDIWKSFPHVKRFARDEVVGTPLATQAFSIVDAIWLQDGRIRELHG